MFPAHHLWRRGSGRPCSRISTPGFDAVRADASLRRRAVYRMLGCAAAAARQAARDPARGFRHLPGGRVRPGTGPPAAAVRRCRLRRFPCLARRSARAGPAGGARSRPAAISSSTDRGGGASIRLLGRSPHTGIGHVYLGLLRALADDYGALVLIEFDGDATAGRDRSRSACSMPILPRAGAFDLARRRPAG